MVLIYKVFIRLLLLSSGLWSEEQEAELMREGRDAVIRAMQRAEREKKPNWREMLQDVYYDMPPILL